MKIYDLDTTLEFGEHRGKTLEEVFLISPKYVEQSIIEESSFLLLEKAMLDMKKMNPSFTFSEEALEMNEIKWMQFEDGDEEGEETGIDDDFTFDAFDDEFKA